MRQEWIRIEREWSYYRADTKYSKKTKSFYWNQKILPGDERRYFSPGKSIGYIIFAEKSSRETGQLNQTRISPINRSPSRDLRGGGLLPRDPISGPKSRKSDSQRNVECNSRGIVATQCRALRVPARILFPAVSVPAIRRSKYPQS